MKRPMARRAIVVRTHIRVLCQTLFVSSGVMLAGGAAPTSKLRPTYLTPRRLRAGRHRWAQVQHGIGRAGMNKVSETVAQPVQSGWKRGDTLDALLTREWLVTNALGGYASGTVGGACTRRFHGHLIAALPAPLARTMMLNHLEEVIEADAVCYRLSGDEHGGGKEIAYPESGFLEEFSLECGLPVWRFSKNGIRIEKRVVMPHLQNTTYIVYRLLEGPPGLKLKVRPSLHFRPHEGLLTDRSDSWGVREVQTSELEIYDKRTFPALRLRLLGKNTRLRNDIPV